MTTTNNLGLPFIEASQAQKHVTHNEALRMLDTLVQMAVRDLSLSAPPSSPAEGDRYIVAAGASGAWSGAEQAVATFEDAAWRMQAPLPGWCAWCESEGGMRVYDGTSWRRLADLLGSCENIPELGVNDSADSANRLTVHSNAALLHAITTGEGGSGDVRLQVSKETGANTASVVFSNNYSGRAEFGLTGSDDFALKVSTDGSGWIDSIRFHAATAMTDIRSGLAWSSMLSPPTLSASQNDYAPSGLSAATVLLLSASTNVSLSGLSAGAAGRIFGVVNTGASSITLQHQNAGSSAANRFALGSDLVLTTDRSVMLLYDAAAQRWRCLARG